MQADALRYNLQYDELLTQAKARQKSHPQDADGFFYEGLALFYKRDYAASISLFQKAAQVANTQEAREMADKWIVSARKEMKVSIN